MLSDSEISKHLTVLKKKHRSVYAPLKYFRGLKTKSQVTTKYLRMMEGTKNTSDKAFRPFVTDKDIKTRPSRYTKAFYDAFPGAKSLQQKARATGIPLKIIREVYDKGVAAWRTGHRPGATKEQWGYARVHSFIMLGCTAFTADRYLVKNAIKTMKPENVNAWKARPKKCYRQTARVEDLFGTSKK